MSDVDWNRYRKCSVCAAEIGQTCTILTGRVVDGCAVDVVEVPAAAPHRRRRLRAGGAR